MTELLKQAIAEIEKLPSDRQDMIASQFLKELEGDRAWESSFDSTTDDQWDKLAAMMRQEVVKGETVELDEIFPPSK